MGLKRIRNAFLFSGGILLFAIFIHGPAALKWMAVSGLTASALVIAFSTRNIPLAGAFGLDKWNPRILIYCSVAWLPGVVLGILARNRYDLPLLPVTLTTAAIISPMIGMTEELVFRGYLQGYLHPLGRSLPILFATTMHTCYKILVILTLNAPLRFDLFLLIFWTFIGGCLFGLMRNLSRSVVPALVAHGVFDILLYGDWDILPLWVWS